MNLYTVKRKIGIFTHRKKYKTGIFLVVFGVFSVILASRSLIFLPTALDQLGEAELSKLLLHSMNDAVGKYLEENDELCLYDIKRNETGDIISVDLRSSEAAKLKSVLSEYTRDEIEKNDTAVSVPVGNLLGSILFSGRGGKINIKLLSVPYVESELISEFKQAGINQTEHTVKVRLTCSVSALAGDKKFSVKCDDDMILSKTLIVGKVPSSYTQLGAYDEGTRKWLYSKQ